MLEPWRVSKPSECELTVTHIHSNAKGVKRKKEKKSGVAKCIMSLRKQTHINVKDEGNHDCSVKHLKKTLIPIIFTHLVDTRKGTKSITVTDVTYREKKVWPENAIK